MTVMTLVRYYLACSYTVHKLRLLRKVQTIISQNLTIDPFRSVSSFEKMYKILLNKL